jgi:hypothetical protein
VAAIITLVDDLDAATGQETRAEKTHRITHNDRSVEIDLSAAHGDELVKMLDTYFEHGRIQRGTTRAATRGHGLTSRKLSRAEGIALRKWADSKGLKHLYTTPGGGYYVKLELHQRWEAHKEAEGLVFE